MPNFLLALVALAAEARLSLERVAAVIGLLARLSYTKQALHKRLKSLLRLARIIGQCACLFAVSIKE
jgi:hypothetical protein